MGLVLEKLDENKPQHLVSVGRETSIIVLRSESWVIDMGVSTKYALNKRVRLGQDDVKCQTADRRIGKSGTFGARSGASEG
jgi:queuine/archaeosine tRNA-ribosyltransferase